MSIRSSWLLFACESGDDEGTVSVVLTVPEHLVGPEARLDALSRELGRELKRKVSSRTYRLCSRAACRAEERKQMELWRTDVKEWGKRGYRLPPPLPQDRYEIHSGGRLNEFGVWLRPELGRFLKPFPATEKQFSMIRICELLDIRRPS